MAAVGSNGLQANGAESDLAEDSQDDDQSFSYGPSDPESEQSFAEGGLEEGISGTSPAQTTFNIVKNIVGEGMLSLPAGLASGTGLVVGCFIAAAFGSLLGYTFSVMGRVCHTTGAKTHKECAAVVSGPALAQTMAVVLMFKTAFTCVSYAMVIGESYSRILHFFNLDGFWSSRQTVLVVIMVVVLLPLCLQRDLSVLSYTSLFGILCEVFVVIFMQVRLSDGSYEPNGKYWDEQEERNRVSFGDEDGKPMLFSVSVSTCVLLASLSTAFIAHYNAPKFYSQMRKRSPRRFSKVVVIAFLIAFGIYVWVMSVGYLTFGKSCRGLILNNYAEHDPGATAARVAIGFAVLFGFPLSFTALRDSTMSAFGLPPEKKRIFFPITLALLSIITLLGAAMNDLGLVNSLGGAIFGALITMIFPAILLLQMARCMTKGIIECGKEYISKREKGFSVFIVVFGVFMLTFGSAIVVIKKYAPHILTK